MYQEIEELIKMAKSDSWSLKLNAINKLGNLIYPNSETAEYVVKNLANELSDTNHIQKIRIIWAIEKIFYQHPKVIFHALSELIYLSNCGDKALENAANRILNDPMMKYIIPKYLIKLSENLYSNSKIVKIKTLWDIWKIGHSEVDLLISILPETIDVSLREKVLDIKIISQAILEGDDKRGINYLYAISKRIIYALENKNIVKYSPKTIKNLLTHPDIALKVLGLILVEKNLDKINNEIINEVLKLLNHKNNFLKVRTLKTLAILGKNNEMRNWILKEIKKLLIMPEIRNNWIFLVYLLVVIQILEVESDEVGIDTVQLLHHENPIVRAYAIRTLKNNLEKALDLLGDNYLIIYLTIIWRFVQDDVDDDIKIKFLNELQSPWNYPYKGSEDEIYGHDIDYHGSLISKVINEWNEENWVSKISYLSNMAIIVKDHPEFVDESIVLAKKALDDSVGIVRAQGLWLLRVILDLNNDIKTKNKINDILNYRLLLKDPDQLVRLNALLIIGKLKPECVDTLIDVALNDEYEFIAGLSKLILKYTYGIDLNEFMPNLKNIQLSVNKDQQSPLDILRHLDSIYEYVKQNISKYPKVGLGCIKFLIKKYGYKDKEKLKDIIKIIHEFNIEDEGLIDVLTEGLKIDDMNVRKISAYMLSKVIKNHLKSKINSIRKKLNDHIWIVRMEGLLELKRINEYNIRITNILLKDIMYMALFDPIFDIRKRSFDLLKDMIEYPCPPLDKKITEDLTFKTNKELIEMLKLENTPTYEILYELSTRDIDEVEEAIIIIAELISSECWIKKAYALKILENILDKKECENYYGEITKWCVEALNSDNPIILETAQRILEKIQSISDALETYLKRGDLQRLETLLTRGDWVVRLEALKCIDEFIEEGHIEFLDCVIKRLKDPHWRIRNKALDILSKVDIEFVKSAIPEIVKLMEDHDESVALRALITIKKFAQKDPSILEYALPILKKLEKSTSWSIREEAIQLLKMYSRMSSLR